MNDGLFISGTHGIKGKILGARVKSKDEAVAKVIGEGGRIVLEKRPMPTFAFFVIVQGLEGDRLGLWNIRLEKGFSAGWSLPFPCRY